MSIETTQQSDLTANERQKLANAEAYDACAEEYKNLYSMNPSPARTKWTNALASSLAPGSHVLEIGCGSGLLTIPFITQGCIVTGVDISAGQIELARELIPTAELIHSDVMSLKFPDASFDAVSAMYVMPHLPIDEQGVMLQRIARWLKPGGVLVFNYEADTNEELHGVIDFVGQNMYWQGARVEDTRKLVQEHAKGLKIVEEEVAVDPQPPGDPLFFRVHWIKAVKEEVTEDN